MQSPHDDVFLKETKPHLGGDKLTSRYDLVEKMQYLYVRVVKARDLPWKDVNLSCDPDAVVQLGSYKAQPPIAASSSSSSRTPPHHQVYGHAGKRRKERDREGGPVGSHVSRSWLASVHIPRPKLTIRKQREVKAKDIPSKDVNGSCDPYVVVQLGNYKETTRHIEKECNPEWNQVFAFSKDRIRASMLEVIVKDKDDFMGWLLFDLTEVPKIVPPESPLAPQWYRLDDRKGKKVKGEIMLAVWWGTEAYEALREALHADAASLVGADVANANLRSKVYLSPTLWYLRVNVIEAQDLVPSDITKTPQLVVKATLGFQSLKTQVSTNRSVNPTWKEELMLLAEEPFEEPLILSVEDRSVLHENKVVGMCVIDLRSVERRLDHKAINTKWFNLQEKIVIADGEKEKAVKFSSRLKMAICLEGGYHVLDESTQYSSDFRPTAKKLWRKSIGVLEVGILGASGLLPMKMKDGTETANAYCVAKYGKKWVRTRTIINSLSPQWNEQCTWEVYDPCTVITIGVFNNCHLPGGDEAGETKNSRIGKIRIRLSTLETDCIYSQAYPLHVLHPSGVNTNGEIHLSVRFTCSSLLNMMHMYSQPLLPKMHYTHPLSVKQLDTLRHRAIQIVSMRLSRAEPPLRKEVVEYMLDEVGSSMWSMRKSKVNIFRIMGVFGGLVAALKWLDDIRNWKNPIATLFIHILLIILVLYPQFILPSTFLSLVLFGVWNHRWRPVYPSKVDIRVSYADKAHPDELDEEFDTFPTSRPADIVRMRYDRLRSISGRLQTVAGDLATQGERLQSLLSWRDPRATTLFIVFCLIAAIVLYAKPFYVVVIQTGFTLLNHPRFQHNVPLVPLNFFRRLPSKIDCML